MNTRITHLKLESRRYFNALVDYVDYLFARFEADRCTRAASSLAYTTLLALVPLLTVVFITLSAVPAFSGWQSAIESFIFDNFVPAFGETIRQYLLDFTSKARGLQAVGVITLGVTVLLMMSTIENTFNVIWRVEKKRPLVTRFLVYWAVITLGPLLIGSSLVATSYVVSLAQFEGMAETYGIQRRLLAATPIVTTTLAFVLFFRVIPNRPVPFNHALVGGIAASVMFEAAKRGFAYYVANFPAQEMIYGAFATLPLFLIWIYVSWLIVLLGAEITVCLTTFNALAPRRKRQYTQERFYAAFRVLSRLYDAQHAGRSCSEKELVRLEKVLPYALVTEALGTLEDAGWVARDENYDWMLARDLHRETVADLMRIEPAPVPASGDPGLAAGDSRDRALGELLEEFASFGNEHLARPIAEFVLAADAEDSARRDVAADEETKAPDGEADSVTPLPSTPKARRG